MQTDKSTICSFFFIAVSYPFSQRPFWTNESSLNEEMLSMHPCSELFSPVLATERRCAVNEQCSQTIQCTLWSGLKLKAGHKMLKMVGPR